MMTTNYSPFFKNEIESFIQDLDRSPITKQSYKTILIKFSEYLKGRYLETPKSRNIIEYKEYLSKTLAPVSIQKTIVVLRGFFHYLARNEVYPDISVGINSMKTTKVMRRDVLNVNDVSLLINIAKAKSYDSLEAYRNYAILSLIATTGLRTIEVE